jgi:hypothetical protein
MSSELITSLAQVSEVDYLALESFSLIISGSTR